MVFETLDSITQTLKEQLDRNPALSRRSFLKISGVSIGTAMLVGCAGKDPDPVDKTYEHKATFKATDLINRANLSGDIVAIRSDGNRYSGKIGELMDLGETKNSLESYTFQILSAGHLLREYTDIAISNNTIDMNLIPDTADVEGMLANVYPSGMNVSWEPRTIAVSYNAIEGTRLTAEQKRGIKDAMEYVKANSNGRITDITYAEGNNDINNTNIPEGQIWCFAEPKSSSVGNSTLPQGGDRVKSGRLIIGSEASYGRAHDETFDVFIQGEQDLGLNYDAGNLGNWFRIMMSRPKGNDNSYRLAVDKETQKGLDNLTSNTSNAQMTYFNNSTSMFSVGVTDTEMNYEHVNREHKIREIERRELER